MTLEVLTLLWKIMKKYCITNPRTLNAERKFCWTIVDMAFIFEVVLFGSILLLTATLCSHCSVLLDVFSLSAVGGLELSKWSLKILSNPKQPPLVCNNSYSFLFASIFFLGWDFLFDFTDRYLHCRRSHHLKTLPSATFFPSISNEEQYVHCFGKRDSHCMCLQACASLKGNTFTVNTYFSCLTHSQSLCCLLLYIVNLENNAYLYADWKKMNAWKCCIHQVSLHFEGCLLFWFLRQILHAVLSHRSHQGTALMG